MEYTPKASSCPLLAMPTGSVAVPANLSSAFLEGLSLTTCVALLAETLNANLPPSLSLSLSSFSCSMAIVNSQHRSRRQHRVQATEDDARSSSHQSPSCHPHGQSPILCLPTTFPFSPAHVLPILPRLRFSASLPANFYLSFKALLNGHLLFAAFHDC